MDTPVWYIPHPDSLVLRTWADQEEAVAYYGRTGSTHLLDPFQTEIVQRLLAKPASSDDLRRSLEEVLDAEDHERLLEHLEATLIQLQAHGLVSRAPL